MKHSELCIAKIQQVREIAGEPELAYAARTRLQRAILACAHLVAHRAGLPEPGFPGRYEPPSGASMALRRVSELANHILARSRSMCQPSEPLDDRWANNWSEVFRLLDELEQVLRTMDGPPNPPLQPTGSAGG